MTAMDVEKAIHKQPNILVIELINLFNCKWKRLKIQLDWLRDQKIIYGFKQTGTNGRNLSFVHVDDLTDEMKRAIRKSENR